MTVITCCYRFSELMEKSSDRKLAKKKKKIDNTKLIQYIILRLAAATADLLMGHF